MSALLLLARIAVYVISWLPEPARRALAGACGRLLYHLPWGKHPVIDANLAMCFPDFPSPERKALHRRYCRELLRLIFEAGVLWHAKAEWLDREIIIESGPELMETAKDSTTGTLYVSGHIGNWELLNLRLSMAGPITTLYRAPSNAALDRFINEPRQRFAARMVPGDRAAIRELLGALRRGHAASIAADIQPKSGDGVFVKFFGIDTLTMTLVHKLARKTGCRVVFTDLTRHPDRPGWLLSLVDGSEWMATDDTELALGRVNDWLEGRIRRTPAQYLWLYKRFSKRPEGEAPRYPKLRKKRQSSAKPPSSGD